MVVYILVEAWLNIVVFVQRYAEFEQGAFPVYWLEGEFAVEHVGQVLRQDQHRLQPGVLKRLITLLLLYHLPQLAQVCHPEARAVIDDWDNDLVVGVVRGARGFELEIVDALYDV